MSQAIQVLFELEQAQTALHPIRLRILQSLAEPSSAAGLSAALDAPRQVLNYHLKELERVGLIQLVEERKKGNCLERLYQATAQSYIVSPQALGEAGADISKVRDQFSRDYVAALGARMVDEVARTDDETPTLSIETVLGFAGSQERAEFAKELTDALAAIVQRYSPNRPETTPYRLIFAAYPKP